MSDFETVAEAIRNIYGGTFADVQAKALAALARIELTLRGFEVGQKQAQREAGYLGNQLGTLRADRLALAGEVVALRAAIIEHESNTEGVDHYDRELYRAASKARSGVDL